MEPYAGAALAGEYLHAVAQLTDQPEAVTVAGARWRGDQPGVAVGEQPRGVGHLGYDLPRVMPQGQGARAVCVVEDVSHRLVDREDEVEPTPLVESERGQ